MAERLGLRFGVQDFWYFGFRVYVGMFRVGVQYSGLRVSGGVFGFEIQVLWSRDWGLGTRFSTPSVSRRVSVCRT